MWRNDITELTCYGSEMVPRNMVQRDYSRHVLVRSTWLMGRDELPGRWWSRQTSSEQHGECVAVLSHDRVLLLL